MAASMGTGLVLPFTVQGVCFSWHVWRWSTFGGPGGHYRPRRGKCSAGNADSVSAAAAAGSG